MILKLLNKKQGQAALMVTVCLIGIISLLALVVDTGRIFVEHTKLQRGVDAATLAAVQDLPLGKAGSNETKVTDTVMKALAYNLNNAEQTYVKDENLNKYLVFSQMPSGQVSVTKEGFDIYNPKTIDEHPQFEVDIQFLTPANSLDGGKNIISVTAYKTVPTRMAMILGYDSWTISAQQIAIIGPIKAVPEILPLGVVVDTDENGLPEKIPLHTVVRLSNTLHDIDDADHSMNQFVYIPIFGTNSSFNGYSSADYNTAFDRTFNGSGDNRYIYTSTVKNAQEVPTVNKARSDDVYLGICNGFNERMKASIFNKATGCINTDEAIDDNMDYNFSFGNIYQRYGYKEDPRLFLLPIVQYTTNYSVNQLKLNGRQREFKIIGFGLFFYQYGHYTAMPATTEYYLQNDGTKVPPAMTEFVGFFTDAIFEGPIDLNTIDYGISGIEFVSPNNEELFSINYDD